MRFHAFSLPALLAVLQVTATRQTTQQLRSLH
jgi:hypothetical protein